MTILLYIGYVISIVCSLTVIVMLVLGMYR